LTAALGDDALGLRPRFTSARAQPGRLHRERQPAADLLSGAQGLRRHHPALWKGEIVDYDGPIGSFKQLHMADTYDGPRPRFTRHARRSEGLPVAASPLFDGVYLQPFLT